MKLSMKSSLVAIAGSVVLSACSHQQVAPEPVVMAPEPVLEQPVVIPAPQPYQDKIVQPAPMKPAPLPPRVVKPKPAPVVVQPRPVVTQPKPVYVPQVKAKGTYRGSIPIASDLRQQYQQ